MSSAGSAIRTGWGFDVHRLGGEPPMILGGVVVSHDDGVMATSDGDVLSHAVTDAVLGAAALGDIGTFFPSSDPEMQGADSIELLRRAVAMVEQTGYAVSHVDVTVVTENVRIAPHREAIIASLSAVLGTEPEATSVKATTTDQLGFIGRGEGLAAMAVATLSRLTIVR